MSLLRQGAAAALTLYIGESDQWQGKPLYVAIMQLLREQGCAGATATRAIAGYGAGARLHEEGHLRWSSDASIVIQVIDQPQRLRRLLPQLQEMLPGGLITMQDVEVLKYTHARRLGLASNMPVRQVMETIVTTVDLDTPTTIVVHQLLTAPFRALPVVDSERRLQGIISTGDLIEAGILPVRRGVVRAALELDRLTSESMQTTLRDALQQHRTAQDIMNRNVRSVREHMTIRQAASIMIETGLRRLPVVAQDGTLLGMLSRADLLQVVVTSPLMSPQASSPTQPLVHSGEQAGIPVQQRPVADYLNPNVTTVGEQAALEEVIDALILSPLKRVVVVNKAQQVQGIISDVDILARMQETMRPGLLKTLTDWARAKKPLPGPGGPLMRGGKAQQDLVAADIMNRDVVTTADTISVQGVIEKMITTRRKVLPVEDSQGRVIGMIGRSDLLHVLLEQEA